MNVSCCCGNHRSWGKWVVWIAVICGGGAVLFFNAHHPEANANDTQAGEESALAVHMEEMNKALRRVRKMVKKPDNPAAILADVSVLEEHTLAAKALVPEKILEMPENERTAAVTRYRKEIIALFKVLLRLETQVIDGQYSKAEETCVDIMDLMKSGHKEFRKQD